MRSLNVSALGCVFKSRAEIVWAHFFERMGARWQYEPIRLTGLTEDGDKAVYTPDFLINESLWVEVKGNYWSADDLLVNYEDSEEWTRRALIVSQSNIKKLFLTGAKFDGLWFYNMDDYYYTEGVDTLLDYLGIGLDSRPEARDVFEDLTFDFGYPYPYSTESAQRGRAQHVGKIAKLRSARASGVKGRIDLRDPYEIHEDRHYEERSAFLKALVNDTTSIKGFTVNLAEAKRRAILGR